MDGAVMGAELSTRADLDRGVVDLVIYDTEADETIVISLPPDGAREQAYNLTVNAGIVEEGGLPDDTVPDIVDLELPE